MGAPLLLVASGGGNLPSLSIDRVGLGLALLLVALNGFFVAAEFALAKVRPTQIEPYAARGEKRGKVAANMITHLDAYLSATQLGITLASIALGWVGEPAFAWIVEPLVARIPGAGPALVHSVALTASFVAVSILHIIFGELVPKSVAIRAPAGTSLWTALPLYLFKEVAAGSWHTQRARDTERQLKKWTGRVTAEQRALLQDATRELQPTSSDWLDSQRQWRAALRDALTGSGPQAAAEQRILQLLREPDAEWTMQYNEGREQSGVHRAPARGSRCIAGSRPARAAPAGADRTGRTTGSTDGGMNHGSFHWIAYDLPAGSDRLQQTAAREQCAARGADAGCRARCRGLTRHRGGAGELNIETPGKKRFDLLSNKNDYMKDIIHPLKLLGKLTARGNRFSRVKCTTQFIVGASDETDSEIIDYMFGLYNRLNFKRVYFSAYQKGLGHPDIPGEKQLLSNPVTPFIREHRLYQADFLIRKYGFTKKRHHT